MNFIYVALLAAVLSAAGAWKVQDWRYAAIENDRMEAARAEHVRQERAIDTAAVANEKDKAEIRTEFITITERITNVVKEPFYVAADAPACLDDAGLRALTDAIRGPAPAASEPARAVPKPRLPSWWKSGGHAQVVD